MEKSFITGKGDVVLTAVQNTPAQKAYAVGDGKKLRNKVVTPGGKLVKVGVSKKTPEKVDSAILVTAIAETQETKETMQ